MGNRMEGNGALLTAIIAAGASIIAAAISFVSTRRKNSAEANVLTSGEWMKLYREMSDRVTIAEQEINNLKGDLDLAKDTIQYLWLGNLENVRYMEAEGMTPPFKPKRSDLRGTDSPDWDWIGE